jgi:Zn-dependent M28 family amino/carboxypeptidase
VKNETAGSTWPTPPAASSSTTRADVVVEWSFGTSPDAMASDISDHPRAARPEATLKGTSMRTFTRSAAVGLFATALILSGCGSDDEATDSAHTTEAARPPPRSR